MDRVSEWVTEYVDMRSRLGELTGNTPSLARSVLGQFARVIDNPPASELTRDHVETWLRRMNVAPSTARTRLSMVRTFCRWLVVRDVIGRDPTLGVKGPREPRVVVRTLDPQQVGRTLKAAPDARAKLVIALMHQEGMRAGEVANLQAGDIDEVNRLAIVVGKGGHQRILPLTHATMAALRRYLAEYPMMPGPLIRSYRQPRRGLSPHYISTLVSGWMLEAGVKARPGDGISGHALRRTAATEVAENCDDPRVIRDMLGHANMNSLHRYVGRMKAERLRSAMEGRGYSREPPALENSESPATEATGPDLRLDSHQ